jgi:hypothetical protein
MPLALLCAYSRLARYIAGRYSGSRPIMYKNLEEFAPGAM